MLILAALAAIGLIVWALRRGQGGRSADLIDPARAIRERARAQGYDDAAADRIAARGGDDRYEMPGAGRVAPDPVAPAGGGFVELTDELREEVWKRVHTGHMIDAVKLVRDRTGLGLKESKDYVDALRRSDVTLR